MRFPRALPLVLVLALGPVVPAAADAPDALEHKAQELDDLRVRIKHHRRKATGLAQDEARQLERLAEIEQEVALTAELLDRLADREVDVQIEMQQSRATVDSVEAMVDARRDRLASRLRAMYKRPRTAGVAALLGSGSLRGLAARVKILTHVARAEQRVIADTRDLQVEFVEQQILWDAALSELQNTRNEAERRRRELGQLEEERKTTLAQLRKERKGYEASAREMEKAAEELADVISKLQTRAADPAVPPNPSTSFAQLKGTLPWPITGRLLRPYGESIHPEFQTVVMNKGINISAAMGTPIRAVAEGVADYVNWLPGYGKCLIVSHGDGFYTLYAHASQLFPVEGQPIEAGDIVGEVGDSGSLEGSQLYFELRQGKDSLNPYHWLAQASR